MDVQLNPLLGWAYFCHSEDTEELRHSLLDLTLEVETMRAAAHKEIRRRDEEIFRLRLLLEKAVKEKEEALEKSRKLLLKNLLLTRQQRFTRVSDVEDEPPLLSPSRKEFMSNNSNNRFSSLSSSDSNESIVSSTVSAFLELVAEKPLPEKGKLLQAVMNAGPLLQTLLLAGPLPQWRHPPPLLEPFNIPPVVIPAPPQQPLISKKASVARKGGHRTGATTPPQRPGTEE